MPSCPILHVAGPPTWHVDPTTSQNSNQSRVSPSFFLLLIFFLLFSLIFAFKFFFLTFSFLFFCYEVGKKKMID